MRISRRASAKGPKVVDGIECCTLHNYFNKNRPKVRPLLALVAESRLSLWSSERQNEVKRLKLLK